MQIRNKTIGQGAPTYIIAEMSGNHGHDFDRAIALVHAAKAAGADAIKLQTYTADTITLRADQEPFRIRGTIFDGRTLHDLYSEACTPWEWQPHLKVVAEQIGLTCFSTPFDASAIDFLEGMDVPAYKIASFELVDLPLIARAAETGKPLILSTGMGTLDEIDAAVRTARKHGSGEVALLKCTSAVPAPLDAMNLRALPLLAARFDAPVGLSDHSPGLVAPVVAVTLGACIIEKHMKLDEESCGPDAAFSLTAAEFGRMVAAVRDAERVQGSAQWTVEETEAASRRFRRSLFVVEDVEAGERFTSQNVRSIRPADGLPPSAYESILGRAASRAIARGTPLDLSMIGGEDLLK